jgi:hypothetical protein
MIERLGATGRHAAVIYAVFLLAAALRLPAQAPPPKLTTIHAFAGSPTDGGHPGGGGSLGGTNDDHLYTVLVAPMTTKSRTARFRIPLPTPESGADITRSDSCAG